MKPIFAECFCVSGLMPTTRRGYHHHIYFPDDKAEVPRGAVTVTPWPVLGSAPTLDPHLLEGHAFHRCVGDTAFSPSPTSAIPPLWKLWVSPKPEVWGAQGCEDQSPGLTLWTASG